jgi:poly(3-hydroxybutyrate) depolymerase
MKLLFSILIGTMIASTSVCAKDDITKELITSNGKTRSYYLYVPPTVKAGAPVPLVVMLHGSGHVGMSLVEKWKDLAKKENFIIAGPDSSDPQVWAVPKDGPDYLRDLVEELRKKYPINPRRIYLFGHSGGASFSMEMGVMEPEYFAAVAIHAGALPANNRDLVTMAKRKIPMYIQVGDRDSFAPVKVVQATQVFLKDNDFPIEVTVIPNHDHWYYDMAPKINLAAWEFLKKYQLDQDPVYRQFNFN